MKKPLIIGNWKMNPVSQKEARHLFETVKKQARKIERLEVVVCPPFVWLPLFASKNNYLQIGAQDCFWERKGPYTGEISPAMLKNLELSYVIVGHSERKKYAKESDEYINRKLKAALKSRLKVILCVGEESQDSFDENGRALNETSLKIGDQLKSALSGVSSSLLKNIVIAYEPVWAISTNRGRPCSSDEAMKAVLYLRKTLAKLYSRNIAEKASIIYGGNVNSKNAIDYLDGTGIDGLFVGSASLNATEFCRILKKVSQGSQTNA